jgi:SAM-dependent methyltransferase
LLTEGHHGSLKNACLLWGEEHLDAWRHLPESLRSGQPAFDLTFDESFFQYLSRHPKVLENYQLAMAEYARDDYAALPDAVDFSQYKQVADVGGGTGILVRMLAKKWRATEFILFEKPAVLAKMQPESLANLRAIGGDFFQPLPFRADAVILARVLHDWPDEQASLILHHCQRSLPPKGRLYLLEILHDEIPTPALNLHMALLCGSKERTGAEYRQLLSSAGFSLVKTRPLNRLQSILIAKKTE